MTITIDTVIEALKTQREAHQAELDRAYVEIDRLVRSAFDHLATNAPEARRLLNAALDEECDISGDCKCLGDLSEEWGVDYETDR